MPPEDRKPNPSRRRGAWRASLAAVLLSGLAVRLWNAWTPLENRHFSGVPDDTFYYFAIARNLAAGLPPSIDGVHPTNGYHPLWMLLLRALRGVAHYEHGARAPLHVAFTVGALLDVGAAWLLHGMLRRLGVHPALRLLVLGAFLFNPYQVELATWGLETPLALAFALAFAHAACLAPPSSRLARPWVVGLLGGLMVLSRTDHAVVLGVTALLRARREPPGDRARYLRTVALVSGAVAAPWPVYSWLTTGTVLQSSSLALAVVTERMPAAWGLTDPGIGVYAARLLSSFMDGAHLVAQFSGLGGVGAAWLAGASLAIALAPARLRQHLAGRCALVAPFGAGLGLLFLLHVGARMVFREWYTAPFIAALLLGVALCLDAARRASPPRARRAGLALAISVVASCLTVSWTTEEVFPRASYVGWEGQADRVEGHTDCGAVSYFLEAKITNLDGVVNQEALAALRQGTLLDYVATQHLQQVVITPQLQSSVFLGARYRERVRGVPGTPLAQALVGPAEKDALIALGQDPLHLGTPAGRELLSDGWDMPLQPLDWVSSVGPRSEVVLTLGPGAPRDPVLEIQLLTDGGAPATQKVTAFVGGREAAQLTVEREPRWYRIPLGAPQEGRIRVRLDYAEPRPVHVRPGEGWWSGWNWIHGYAARAVRAGAVRLRSLGVALPPEGPPLAAPGAESLLRAGFLGIERTSPTDASVWAIASPATIEFVSSLPPDGRTLVLEIGPPPREGDLAGQHVDVAVNGHPVAGLNLAPDTVSTERAPLPGGILRPGVNELTLRFERLSPADAAGIRRGAYLRRIALE